MNCASQSSAVFVLLNSQLLIDPTLHLHLCTGVVLGLARTLYWRYDRYRRTVRTPGWPNEPCSQVDLVYVALAGVTHDRSRSVQKLVIETISLTGVVKDNLIYFVDAQVKAIVRMMDIPSVQLTTDHVKPLVAFLCTCLRLRRALTTSAYSPSTPEYMC